MTVDKSLLLKPHLEEAEVEIPGFGSVVVRGLSRAEVFMIQKVAGSGEDLLERKYLSLALIDPKMTESEVREWQEASPPGELQPVIEKIIELSGMAEGAAKETYEELASEPGAEFRDVPGEGTGDDAGRAPGSDVPG